MTPMTVGAATAVVGGVLGATFARARLRNWGATRQEIEAVHTGDDLVTAPVTTTTYAVPVDAPADVVWRWLVQIGQDRGGMYSYEWVENLFGLDIHNANQIRDEWQHLAVGDQVRVVPRGKLRMRDGYAFRVTLVDPPHALVLRQQPPEHPWDSTWAFLVIPEQAGRCRLLSRSRTAKGSGAAAVAARLGGELMGPVIFVMTRRMLLGIKERAEHRTPTTTSGGGRPPSPAPRPG